MTAERRGVRSCCLLPPLALRVVSVCGWSVRIPLTDGWGGSHPNSRHAWVLTVGAQTGGYRQVPKWGVPVRAASLLGGVQARRDRYGPDYDAGTCAHVQWTGPRSEGRLAPPGRGTRRWWRTEEWGVPRVELPSSTCAWDDVDFEWLLHGSGGARRGGRHGVTLSGCFTAAVVRDVAVGTV